MPTNERMRHPKSRHKFFKKRKGTVYIHRYFLADSCEKKVAKGYWPSDIVISTSA